MVLFKKFNEDRLNVGYKRDINLNFLKLSIYCRNVDSNNY
jgi:hypothetical protein